MFAMTTADPQTELEVRAATVGEIIVLRHAELRAGLPFEAANFDGDNAPDTLHFGAFDPTGHNIGCASFMLNQYEGVAAYQLRGMASRKDLAKRGVGRALLAIAEGHILKHTPVRLLWCNARVPAVGFYEKQGWRVVSDEFVIPTAGPHRKMAREIGSL